MSGTLPPRRISSCEMTAVIPRDALPPVSVVPGPTIEQLDEARRALADVTETLVGCEGPCRTCACCHGAGMVTPERQAEWRRMHPQGG